MKKVLLTLCLSAMFGMAMAQDVKTYSVYDTNQSGDLNVADVTEVVDKVKANVAAASTQQYVTGEELNGVLSNIYSELGILKKCLSSIASKVGAKTPEEIERASKLKTFTANGVTFKMMPVEGGSFTMGATSEQSNGYSPDSNEKPTHEVTLSDYYIGETEVTQALWYAVMGAKPSSSYSWSSNYGLGDNYPAYNISYTECQEFINKLNTLTGTIFRMPTEAEWEYAARGGSLSKEYIFSGSNTIDDVAWYTTTTNDSGTKPVATKSPNELGIYDMSGNVWEWCSDWYGSYSSDAQTNPTGPTSGSYRVYRGGCWVNDTTNCRVAYRYGCAPSDHNAILGLRLALSQL